MKKSTNIHLLASSLLLLFLQCAGIQEIEEADFISGQKIRYYSSLHPESVKMIQRIRANEEKRSYQALYDMKIVTEYPVKKNFSAKVKVVSDPGSMKVRIFLMDPFFGMVFSQVIADENTISIKSGDNIDKIPMGDLVLNDPKTERKIVIPFTVIYSFLVSRPLRELQNHPAFYNNAAEMCTVRKPGEKFTYQFYEGRLRAVELFSEKTGTRAIAAVENSVFPPTSLSAKVVDNRLNRQKDLVMLKRRSIRYRDMTEKDFIY